MMSYLLKSKKIITDSYPALKLNFISIEASREQLSSCLSGLSNEPDGYYFMELIITSPHNNLYKDLFVIIGTKNEITDAHFLSSLKCAQSNDDSHKGLLRFLERKWSKEKNCYPFYFYVTLNFKDPNPFLHLNELGVAPDYRNQGIMKKITLNILTDIKKHHQLDWQVQAICVHPATYKLFNPHDKNLESYVSGIFEQENLDLFLKDHQQKSIPQPSFFYPPFIYRTKLGLAYRIPSMTNPIK